MPQTLSRRRRRETDPPARFGRFTRADAIVAGAGGALIVLYGMATIRLSLPRYFPGNGTTVTLPEVFGAGEASVVSLYAGFVLASFACFTVALTAAWRRRVNMGVLVGVPLVSALVLAWMYPVLATDVFAYQAQARVFWLFHDNPYLTPPSAYPFVLHMYWLDRPTVYGPLWTLLTGLPLLLGGGHHLIEVVLFKLMAGGAVVGAAVVIARAVRATRPGWEPTAVVLFAWNPFTLVRTAGMGHNDIVMVFFALLGYDALRRRRWTLALLALTAAVLTKYVVALLVPLALSYAWSRAGATPRARARVLAPACAAAGALAVLCFAPFWRGPAIFHELVVQATAMGLTSARQVAELLASAALGGAEVSAQVRWSLTGLYGALYLALLWRARRSYAALVTCSAHALFLYLILALGWYRPWYVLWPVAFAALAPGVWFVALALALTFSNSWFDLVEQYGGAWPWLVEDTLRAFVAPVFVALAPAVVVWLQGVIECRTWLFDSVEPDQAGTAGPAARAAPVPE